MEKKYRVNEIASLLGVSQTTIYKRFAGMKKRLKPHACKEKGILLFDETALEVFQETITTADKEVVPVSPVAPQDNNRLEGIEKALLAMAEKMTGLVEMNRVILEENRAIRNEVFPLRDRLEYKATEEKPTPAKVESPLPVVIPDTAASIREKVIASEMQKPPVQRVLSFRQSLSLLIDNFCGFLVGD